MFGVCRSEGSAELSTNFLPTELTLGSRSRDRVRDRSSRSRASRSRSGHAVALTVHASPDGVESPRPDRDVREREVPREAIEALRQDFRERFGRDPGPDDPVFFDPSAEEPRTLDEDGEALFIAMSEMAMRRAGIDPSLIYASRKTGLLVTERNQHLVSSTGRARRRRMSTRRTPPQGRMRSRSCGANRPEAAGSSPTSTQLPVLRLTGQSPARAPQRISHVIPNAMLSAWASAPNTPAAARNP
jgi:hypothetical protein